MQTLSPAAVVNGFPNPRAATNLNGWVASGAAVSIAQSATDGYLAGTCVDVTSTSGTQAAVVAGSPATTYGCPVSAGQLVFVRCAVKHVSAPGAVQYAVTVSYYNAAGTTLSTQNVHSPLASRMPGGVWSVVDGFDVAPANAAFAQVTVTLTSTAGAAEFRVADMQITPDTGSGGVPAECYGDRPGCAWVGTAHASASVGPSGYVNLVPNPQTSQAVSGTFGANTAQQIVAPVTVLGGQEYTARVSATLTSVPVGARCYLRLSWLDSAGTLLSESSQADAIIPAAGGETICTKAAPATAHQARLDVVVDTAGSYTLAFASNALIADSGALPTRLWLRGFNDNNPGLGPKTYAQDVALYQELAANTVRFGGLSLDEAQPTSASPVRWDNTRWARMLSACRQAGVKAIPNVGSGAAWMSGVIASLSAAVSIPSGQAGTGVPNLPLTSTAGFNAAGGYVWLIADSGQVVAVGFTGITGSSLTGCTLGLSATADTASTGAQVAQQATIAQTVSNASAIGTAVGQLAAEYSDVIAAVEVWNEPNLTVVWPGPDPATYTTFLRSFYTAFKAQAPTVPVLGGALNQYSPNNSGSGQDATGMDPGTFLASMYSNGAIGHMDAVSCHPYSNLTGTGSPPASDTNGAHAGFWPTVDKVRTQIAAAGDTVPIYVTEVGVKVTQDQPAAAQAAMYAAWQGLLRRQPDLRCCLIHTLFQNQLADPFPADFGVIRWPGDNRRPAFFRLQAQWQRSFVGYFDGATTGASWTGTANASASVLPVYRTVTLTGQEGTQLSGAARLQPGVRPAHPLATVTLGSSATVPVATKQPQPTRAAATAAVAAVVKQARPVRKAASTVAAVLSTAVLRGANLLTVAATVAVTAVIVRQPRVVKAAVTAVSGRLIRVVSIVRRAASALIGFFLPGATPAIVTVAVTPATHVTVTVGPL